MSIMDLFQLIGGGSPTTAEPTPVDPSVASTGYEAPPSSISALIGPGEVDWRRTIRAVGGGMANMGNTGGDPYLAFGQGFGGATNSLQERDDYAAKMKAAQDKAAADAAVDAEKTAYERQQDALKQTTSQDRWDAEMEIKKAAEERAKMVADMTTKKSAAQIERLAKTGGVTVEQMLQIERIAQAAAENIIDPTERKQVIETERKRLTDQVRLGSGISTGPGITAAGEGVTPEQITATGPNGEKVVLRDGQWTPLESE